jgi:hypothetical protein
VRIRQDANPSRHRSTSLVSESSPTFEVVAAAT